MDAIEIRNELNRILTSRCFRSRRVLRRFLAYIVEANLAGKQLSQQVIAIHALGQSMDFNDLDNPLVRVHAGRLRKQLEDYYATEGYFNTLRISLPLGGYQPAFTVHLEKSLAPYEHPTAKFSLGPSLICIPRDLTSDNNNWAFIACLSRDYVTALSRFSFCQILFIDEVAAQTANWPQDLYSKHQADFGFFLDLYKHADILNLKCSLVHSITTEIVWAHSVELGTDYPDSLQLQQLFKRLAHDTIGYERGLAHDYWVKYLLNLNKPIPPQYQLMVSIRHHAWHISAPPFHKSVATCLERLRINPNDVTALIIYADQCRIDYLLKYEGIPNLKATLFSIVERLQQLAPSNPYTYLFTGFAYMLDNDFPAAAQALEQAQALNPLDVHINILSGMIYIAIDQWELGATYVADCIDSSPLHPDWYHIPLCIYYYRENRYLDAIQQAKKIKFKHLWGPILRAALYQCNNAEDKSLKEYQNLLLDYPDVDQKQHSLTAGFTSKSHAVISRIWSHLPKKPSD